MKTIFKTIAILTGACLFAASGFAQTWSATGGGASSGTLTDSATESAVTINPADGVTLVRSAAVGTRVVNLSASSPVQVGQSTSVTWSTSGITGTVSCTRTNGWTGTSGGSGTQNVTMPGTAQTVTLTLTCTGDNGSASASANVTVSANTGGTDCTSRPPSYLGSPRTLVNASFSTLWGILFPGVFDSASITFPNISDGTVLAFAFTAPPASASPSEGYILNVLSPVAGGRGTIAAGFSECPGEMSNTTTPTCKVSDTKPRSEWTVIPPGRQDACNMVPGRLYYYNLSMDNAGCVSGPDPGTPGASCAYRIVSKKYL